MSETILFKGVPFSKAAVLAMQDGDKIWQAGIEAKANREKRKKIKENIKKNVGDADAILGTTNDVTQLAAVGLLILISAAGKGNTFQAYRKVLIDRVEGFIPSTAEGVTIFDQADRFLQQIQSGDIVLTAGIKGFANVLLDLAQRSTSTAAILADAEKSEI